MFGLDAQLLISISLAAGAILCLGGASAALWRRRDPAWRRVDELAQEGTPQPFLNPFAILKQAIPRLLSILAKPAQPKKPWEVGKLKRELYQAGLQSPSAVSLFLGIKTALCLLLPLVAYLVPAVRNLSGAYQAPALVAAAGVGFLAPSFVLEALATRRKDAIARELPEVLDLLVIAVEAGLGMDAAIKRVAREVRIGCPNLSSEMSLISLELKAGVPRDQALKGLAERCAVEEVSSLVNMLNQADRFGVSVGRSLRVHSDTVRTKWRQKMEEKAAKVPLKLLFPVLFLIFPAVLMVMAGPAIIRVSETIMK